MAVSRHAAFPKTNSNIALLPKHDVCNVIEEAAKVPPHAKRRPPKVGKVHVPGVTRVGEFGEWVRKT